MDDCVRKLNRYPEYCAFLAFGIEPIHVAPVAELNQDEDHFEIVYLTNVVHAEFPEQCSFQLVFWFKSDPIDFM